MKPHIMPTFLLAPLLLMLGTTPAWADGTLTHMSGAVSVLKADGKTVQGTPGARAYTGDTVITGAGGHVRMEMTDGGEMVLRPDSQLKIDAYQFTEAKPAEDSFVFRMLKGGLRTVTGYIGKRGNRDAYELNTYTATIGIRGTQFDLRVCQGDCGALADGTYVAVRFGAVQTANSQGSLQVGSGQVAYVPLRRPAVMLPRDPGIGFTPPAVIPKLDEKKKEQAATAATTVGEPAKPEPSGTTSQASTMSPTQQPAAETQVAAPAPDAMPVQANTASDFQAVATPLAPPPAQSMPGMECSVQ